MGIRPEPLWIMGKNWRKELVDFFSSRNSFRFGRKRENKNRNCYLETQLKYHLCPLPKTPDNKESPSKGPYARTRVSLRTWRASAQ